MARHRKKDRYGRPIRTYAPKREKLLADGLCSDNSKPPPPERSVPYENPRPATYIAAWLLFFFFLYALFQLFMLVIRSL